MDGTWTIGELAEHAAAALAADGSAQVSGRVRDLPNERLIRWYTTIGLVDPPLGRRGRTALYGPRHLLQLVAVKRRQAEGRSIAEIQVELAAATDATLSEIAALPAASSPAPRHQPAAPADRPPPSTGQGEPGIDAEDTAASGAPVDPTATPARPPGLHGLHGLHAQPTDSSDGAPEPAAPRTPTAQDGEQVPRSGLPGRSTSAPAPAHRRRSRAAAREDTLPAEADAETAHPTEGPAAEEKGRERGAFWSARPDVSFSQAAVADGYGASRPAVVQGVRLAPGLTVLLDAPTLSGDDLAAIETAARPLLDELRRLGLLSHAETPAFPPADESRRIQ
ncbi:MerR family transcriptional regulator [Spirillospora sp. CA-128828]|uniref:MerR family transcriptional regulator n=1 Tax=Spirillospora sp. CA-128828 TaxID=3240033 RepID=UPI003D908993